jgi:hypothetical protein
MELLDGVFESNGAMDVRVGNIYVLMSRKGQSGSVRSTPKRGFARWRSWDSGGENRKDLNILD